ncbi:serine hydrolase domain-containing protein [Lentzea indica]|uniref:serine hydrolase domain-containing protein n=1 Tax=Lentzea indica TaxID=2604800 RepID=UPI001439FF8C|nr:serine hydrolase domain-containing protein [Lentzea indica]
MNTTAEWLHRRLPELIAEHGIVGAQVAVLHNGEIVDTAAGVLNNVTNEPVTTDSIFQIGSITKVWTATLIQELVNERLLDLDRPVRDVIPRFRLADEQAAQVITPRHLLSHTAGFEGDLFLDTGTGDDMLEKYLELMGDAKQETPPGELYTYCNSGFVVLGRLVEVLRGKPFHTVLRERLVDRLGLRTPATRHAEYSGRRAAEGHLGTELKPVDELMTEADGPAGSVLAMCARDLLEFVRMHLETTEFDAMRETQVVPPDFGLGGRQGLGWMLHDYDNGMAGMGHTGQTLGFLAWLRVIPEAGFAITVLTNGGEALPVVTALYEKAMHELANARLPGLPKPPATPVPVDVERVVGVYRAAGLDVHIAAGEQGRVKVRYVPRTKVYEALTDTDEHEYTWFRDDALIAVEEKDGFHSVIVLCGRDEQDRVKWVHYGRAAVRQ